MRKLIAIVVLASLLVFPGLAISQRRAAAPAIYSITLYSAGEPVRNWKATSVVVEDGRAVFIGELNQRVYVMGSVTVEQIQ